MIKYASNALLATMISFSNEFASLCARLGGIDIKDVMAGVHTSEYFSTVDSSGKVLTAPITKYLEAGCGFGGSCLPKDVKALVSHAEAAGLQLPLLSVVIAINVEQPNKVIELLGKHFDSPAGLSLAVLGLSFKPGTDDVRESPAFPVMRTLLDGGANLRAYDPAAIETARHVLDDPRIVYCSSLREAVTGVDAVFLLTRWKEFLELPEILRAMVPTPVLIDGRRLIDKSSVERYEGIGL